MHHTEGNKAKSQEEQKLEKQIKIIENNNSEEYDVEHLENIKVQLQDIGNS